jgi:hypothetical protein
VTKQWMALAPALWVGLATFAPAQEQAARIQPAPQGQQKSQDELVAERDKKLAKEFLKAGGWVTDYDKAREEAKKSGKLMFAYFSRSYAG